jgi:hypothetical protein
MKVITLLEGCICRRQWKETRIKYNKSERLGCGIEMELIKVKEEEMMEWEVDVTRNCG